MQVARGATAVQVLIVDDEMVVAQSTAEIFRIAGHNAMYATSAAKALEVAKEFRPDVLITDVVMPEQNGVDLAISIVSEIPTCKVLLISGQAETSNILDGAQQKGYHFDIVAKPLWPPELIRHAESLVAGGRNSESASAAG